MHRVKKAQLSRLLIDDLEIYYVGPFVRQTSLLSLSAFSHFYNHSQHHDEITIRMCIKMLDFQHSLVLFFFTSKITTTHCLSQAGRGIHVKEFRSGFKSNFNREIWRRKTMTG